MKSERRHELEHNELADWSVNAAEKIKPYTNVIVGGALAVVILAVAISLWAQSKSTQANAAWNMYYAALSSNNPSLLQDVIEMYPSAEAAQWAAVCKGDMRLISGCNDLFDDKANANQELEQAIESYKAVKASDNQLINERAAFGLARAYEAQGDLEKAKTAYEKQLKNWKNGPYAEIAKSRLADLEKPSTLAFYDRFEKYEPKPDFSTEGIPSFESTDLPAPEEKPATEEKPDEEKKDEK